MVILLRASTNNQFIVNWMLFVLGIRRTVYGFVYGWLHGIERGHL